MKSDAKKVIDDEVFDGGGDVERVNLIFFYNSLVCTALIPTMPAKNP